MIQVLVLANLSRKKSQSTGYIRAPSGFNRNYLIFLTRSSPTRAKP